VPDDLTLSARSQRLPAVFTVKALAARWKISPDKVRRWIARGELRAMNTSETQTGKPRWVVLPDEVARFEKGRQAAPPKPARRRRKRTLAVDYYPD
jgi:hypothetical protein